MSSATAFPSVCNCCGRYSTTYYVSGNDRYCVPCWRKLWSDR